MSGIFDVIGTACFVAALGFSAVTVRRSRGKMLSTPSIYLLFSMAIMTFVSFSNALEHLGVTAALDAYEDYVEIPLLPLLTYAMYGMYIEGHARRIAESQSVVEQLSARLAASSQELGENRLVMLQALTAAVDARDHYTALHSMHVADYACATGYRLGMIDDFALLERAGLLHDIGKIAVADTLLLKPARLSEIEYNAIKRHVEESATILGTVPFLAEIVPAVRHHHERWDGTGYPDGLAGEDIPLAARVLAVADAFDAMTTDRPYRAALPVSQARENLLTGAGTQFDPLVVESMVTLLDAGIVLVGKQPAVA